MIINSYNNNVILYNNYTNKKNINIHYLNIQLI